MSAMVPVSSIDYLPSAYQQCFSMRERLTEDQGFEVHLSGSNACYLISDYVIWHYVIKTA